MITYWVWLTIEGVEMNEQTDESSTILAVFSYRLVTVTCPLQPYR
jgi:hypothetical protein